VTGYLPAYGRDGGAITDDTQMTLFTAEGLIRARVPFAHPASRTGRQCSSALRALAGHPGRGAAPRRRGRLARSRRGSAPAPGARLHGRRASERLEGLRRRDALDTFLARYPGY